MMKAEQWKTYRTRFLVNAKQLNSSLSFVDHLGRQHLGRKGDYLVESSDGVLSIAPRHIFEDIYVPMSLSPQPSNCESSETMIAETTIEETMTSDPTMDETTIDLPEFNQASIDRVKFEALEIEELTLPKTATDRQPVNGLSDSLRNAETAVGRRKLPQPCRERQGAPEPLRLM
jgi:hypothetical protein